MLLLQGGECQSLRLKLNAASCQPSSGDCTLSAMPVCPICNKRAAKRSCPALRTKICAVCCARERMIELACPDSCTYLRDARTQMAAREVEWREREREAGIIRSELGQQWLAYLLMTQHAIVNAH